MKGYHYTSYTNWLQIREKGLKPYTLTNLKMRNKKRGIWLWPTPLYRQSRLGTILYQLATKGDPTIVCLEVNYQPEDVWQPKKWGFDTVFVHDGSVDKWPYHYNERGIVVSSPISPDNIRLHKYYDLLALIEGGDAK